MFLFVFSLPPPPSPSPPPLPLLYLILLSSPLPPTLPPSLPYTERKLGGSKKTDSPTTTRSTARPDVKPSLRHGPGRDLKTRPQKSATKPSAKPSPNGKHHTCSVLLKEDKANTINQIPSFFSKKKTGSLGVVNQYTMYSTCSCSIVSACVYTYYHCISICTCTSTMYIHVHNFPSNTR